MTGSINYDGMSITDLIYGTHVRVDMITFRHVKCDDGICDYSIDGGMVDRFTYSELVKAHTFESAKPSQTDTWVEAVSVAMDWSRLKADDYAGVYWCEGATLKAVNAKDGADTDQFEYMLLHENNRLTALDVTMGQYNSDGVRVGGYMVSLKLPVTQDDDLESFSNLSVTVDPAGPVFNISTLDDSEHEHYDSYLDELDPVIGSEDTMYLEDDLGLIVTDDLLNTTDNRHSAISEW